jgi:hypothetical protein|tara:strand:+ start:3268 stop:3660 length:393 start_codon:yes stop_codon:yes gene_type:complete
MLDHINGREARRRPNATARYLFLRPDRKITTSPEKAMRIEVPRSGSNMINTDGTNTIVMDTPTEKTVGGRAPLAMYRAIIKGIAIFISSDGWKLMPIFNHLVAPFLVSPITRTKINKTRQRRKSQGPTLP